VWFVPRSRSSALGGTGRDEPADGTLLAMARRDSTMRRSPLSVLFALDMTLLVLLVVSFQFVRPGTTEYAILQVSLVIILLTAVGLAVAARRGWNLYEP
jgi:hypothetical protein